MPSVNLSIASMIRISFKVSVSDIMLYSLLLIILGRFSAIDEKVPPVTKKKSNAATATVIAPNKKYKMDWPQKNLLTFSLL